MISAVLRLRWRAVTTELVDQLLARFQGILDRFDDAAQAWSEIVVATPDISQRCAPEHLAAVPERYLELRFHLAELAGGALPPVEAIVRAPDAHGPECIHCKLPLQLPPHRGAKSAQGRFWDPGQRLDVIAVACQSCGRLWSVDASEIPPPPVLDAPPRPLRGWSISDRLLAAAFAGAGAGAALTAWLLH